MSQAPFLVNQTRWGQGELQDGLRCSVWWYPHGNHHRKWGGEVLPQPGGPGFAAESQRKAIESGRFMDEMVPAKVPQQNLAALIFDTDEYPMFGATVEKLARCLRLLARPANVTAGNGTGIAIIVKLGWLFKASTSGCDPCPCKC